MYAKLLDNIYLNCRAKQKKSDPFDPFLRGLKMSVGVLTTCKVIYVDNLLKVKYDV